ncbi:RtcB family protein [Mucilaginibacter myungsuensis]|uniref:3'-phosphate/5'-hydroxy nucleic acid ligase n=1 Tax=Mucilaginibacter myungsuensis TaxID=649104 RepID=A0A929PWJ4_9SPHI|nr:RtcB family protein [Mucilaginibacter myungsuensis]MBE9662898.1 RtcB family protein [Mucilaginibacter myungsuensis]MDN3598518.1 RtcB family protein [Mucilaginibacter myungsuensis]
MSTQDNTQTIPLQGAGGQKEKISNNNLQALGITEPEVLANFSRVANGLLKHNVMSKAEILANLEALIDDPMPYAMKKGGKFKNLAEDVIALRKEGKFVKQQRTNFKLKEEIAQFPTWGIENIEVGALAQMRTAIQLPIAVAGALMPDAHQGYGLPIGGVLATTANTIIPFAVGVDIACRMCLSIFDMPAEAVDTENDLLKKLLLDNSYFGIGVSTKSYFDSSLFDSPTWNETKVIRSLKDKAYAQLGTSGTGNHFVEWGELNIADGVLHGIPAGRYLALLSHSGSRGFGGSVADHYSKIAMTKTKLPAEAKHLAWLDLDKDEGQEYWIAMNLAGEYASANHHEIHNKIARALGQQPLTRIENHHNFAWKEQLADGSEVMVHRKGATPAGEGVLGIIPGSMSTPGFVVRGKGDATSINSASHGAGRTMSRSAAFKTLDRQVIAANLVDKRITLMGSDMDEAPMAYKDIHKVMAAQRDLVDVLAEFHPRIVRMANPKEKPED